MLVIQIVFIKLIFSDESRFYIQIDDQFKWYRKGEIQDKTKFKVEIIVFEMIGIGYKGKLVQTIQSMIFEIDKSLSKVQCMLISMLIILKTNTCSVCNTNSLCTAFNMKK